MHLSFFKIKRKKYYHQAYMHARPKKTEGGERGVLVLMIYRMNHNLKRIIATQGNFRKPSLILSKKTERSQTLIENWLKR